MISICTKYTDMYVVIFQCVEGVLKKLFYICKDQQLIVELTN